MSIGDSVNVSSPNFPNRYPPNQECIWFFNARNSGSYFIVIKEMLLVHHLGNGVRNHDSFIIGRGNILGEEELFQVPRFVAPDTAILAGYEQLWMVFRSDFVYHQKGFQIIVSRVSLNGKFDFNQ